MSLAIAILFVFGGIFYLIYQGFKSGMVTSAIGTIVGNYSRESMHEENGYARRESISRDLAFCKTHAGHVFDFLGGISVGQFSADVISIYIAWLGGYTAGTDVVRISGVIESTTESRMERIEQIYQFSKNRKPLTQERRDEIWRALGCMEDYIFGGNVPLEETSTERIEFNRIVEVYPETIQRGVQSKLSREILTQGVIRQEFLCPLLSSAVKDQLVPFYSFETAEKEYLIFEGYDLDAQYKMIAACTSVLPVYVRNGHSIDLDELNQTDKENFSVIYPRYKEILDELTEDQLDAEILAARFLGLQGKKYYQSKKKQASIREHYTYPEIIQKLLKQRKDFALNNSGKDWLEVNYCYKWTQCGNEILDKIRAEKKSPTYRKRELIGWIGRICGVIQFYGFATIYFDLTDDYNKFLACGALWLIGLPLWIYFYWYKYRGSKDKDMEFDWAKNFW